MFTHITTLKAKLPVVKERTVYYLKVTSILTIFAGVMVFGLPGAAIQAFIAEITWSQLAGATCLVVGTWALLSGYLQK